MSARFVRFVILGEVAFGLVLGVTVSLYNVRSAAEQRKESLRQISSAVASALMPVVADQEASRVNAQLKSIIKTSEAGDITCMRVVDGYGEVIAHTSADENCCDRETPVGMLTMFTEAQVIAQPLVLDGLEVAQVYVEFAPSGLWEALASPTLAGLVVVLAVALVSAPWTAWLVVQHVIEPLTVIKDGATDLAKGRRDLALDDGRKDEIGDLARALEDLSMQLRDKEERLLASYQEVSSAYESEAKAKEEIEEMMRAKSNFVAVASHELRSPLAVIRLYTELLEDGEFGELANGQATALSAVASATARLGSIVSDLMDAALLERGLMPLEFSDVRMDALVADAVGDASMLAEYRRGITVEMEGPTEETWVWGDGVRLRQVLDNLLSNAVKYSDGAPKVSVRFIVGEEAVSVEVADTGRGVPRRNRGMLFRLFGRLDAEDNRDTAGLGLGLAISARIAEAHGGRISFRENEGGKGAVFTLALPFADAQPSDETTLLVDLVREGGDEIGSAS